jgi:hypothetical protein
MEAESKCTVHTVGIGSVWDPDLVRSGTFLDLDLNFVNSALKICKIHR